MLTLSSCEECILQVWRRPTRHRVPGSLRGGRSASFAEARPGEEGEADRADPEEFEPVPEQQGEQQVEAFVPAVPDKGDAHRGGEDVSAAEDEHCGDAPFEAWAGADLVEEDVRGHPAAQESTGVDAVVPESMEERHGGVSLSHGSYVGAAGPVW